MQLRIRISYPAPRSVEERPLETPTGEQRAPTATIPPPNRFGLGASSQVAFGILASRLTGLLRERLTGHFFGISGVADAFRQAIRIPNLLNNLFGEGVLSASFVTVYAKLRATGNDEEAEDTAASVFAILGLLCAVLVLAGVILTPFLIDVIAPGFHGAVRVLTIQLVRILFPATGLLVMSAWCLGVLNSHRRFLLSYMAPIAMNATMITALIAFGPKSAPDRLAIDLAWASIAGAGLQFLVQLPKVLQFLPHFRPRLEWDSPHVRSVMRNFGPVFLSRGVVQLSAYIDSMIASFLPVGAVATLGYAQVIYTLPVSLFSMSVSAAELPALSSAVGGAGEVAAFLQRRLAAGLRRIAFFTVPSAMAFLVLGDVVGAALYQSGRFHHADAVYLWSVLAGSAVGLLATGLGRLYSSAFYALLDTRTPLRFAVIRVGLTTGLGLVFALLLPRWLGVDPRWGVAGLSASAGMAGWVEFALLRRSLHERIGRVPMGPEFTLTLWAVAFVSAICGYFVKLLIGPADPKLVALVVLPFYGALYFAGTAVLGIAESRTTLRSAKRVFGR